jgi:hypothetical protein
MTTALTTVPSAYRGSDGRFAKGNPGGPGNPHARQVARLKSALHEALTEEGIAAVARAMLEKAQEGDVAAARLLLEYSIGKPVAGTTASVIDTAMTEQLMAERLTVDELRSLAAIYAKLGADE